MRYLSDQEIDRYAGREAEAPLGRVRPRRLATTGYAAGQEAGYGDGDDFDEIGQTLKPWIAGGGLVICVLIALAAWYGLTQTDGGGGGVPMVTADNTPIKVRPDQPGGLQVPFQDMELYEAMDPGASGQEPERLLASPEEPVRRAPVAPVAIPAIPEPPALSAALTESLLPPAAEQAEPAPSQPATVAQLQAQPQNQPVESLLSPQAEQAEPGRPEPFARPEPEAVEVAVLPTPQPVNPANAITWDGPPVPLRKPLLTVTGTSVPIAAAPPAPGSERLIRQNVIDTPRAVAGLDGTSDVAARVGIRSNTVTDQRLAPPASLPQEGPVQIEIRDPAEPATIQTAAEAEAAASDGGPLVIRSPNREPPITITSESINEPLTQQAQGRVPDQLPRSPDRPAGFVPPSESTQTASTEAIPAAELEPPGARPEPLVSEGIRSGFIANRPPAPKPTPPARQVAAAGPPPEPPAQQVQQPATPQQTAVATGTGNWRVQLAAVRSQGEAVSEWRRYSETHADLLGGLNLRIQRIDLGERGIFFRVQGGDISRDEASRICSALEARGTDCLIKQP